MDQRWPSNLVLVGRMGNGKSATGNTILGEKKFKSRVCLSGVTSSCELHSTIMDEKVINVIDTPGLFDTELTHEFLVKEIVKCLELARGGFDALLLVFSASKRFTKEEEASIDFLKDIFGIKIENYIIIVLTGLDVLEDDDEASAEGFLDTAPESLKKILENCKNRHVFFDNKTKDDAKNDKQVQKLLQLVARVGELNNNLPFTNECIEKLQNEKETPADEVLRMTEMYNHIDKRLKESTERFQKHMYEEMEARIRAEMARDADAAEIEKLRLELQNAKENNGGCSIL